MSAIDLLLALDEALAKPDWAARIRELCTTDCEFIDVGPGVITDLEGFIEIERAMLRAWSNQSTEQIMLLGDDRHAMVEMQYRATHSGLLHWHGHDYPATGREWQLRFVRCITVTDGKVSSIRDYFNDVSFMRQLGIPLRVAESSAIV